MALRIYNTLSRETEEFRPIQGKKVKMFVCGPTVYDYSHIGHAKTYTQFDFICRYLKSKGYEVFYLMNITDIDDKIIARAKERGVSPKELAEQNDKLFREDMASLHDTSIAEYAKATDYIPQIVKQVKTLIEKGFAYRISDGYYFDLKKFKDYGKLSRRTSLIENDAVSRVDENPEKRNKGDFCLWKFSKEGEPSWDTELGKGRPGWHIEDTAITESHFGVQYDIHGGAVDLIFPHHEAEIAQQEAASGKKPFVKYWMHAGFLNINSEKMSKSKGNFLTIRDAVKEYGYRVLRLFFIRSHYRSSLDLSPKMLEEAKNLLQRIDEFIFNADPSLDDAAYEQPVSECKAKIYAALDSDFDSQKAFSILLDFIKASNSKGGAGRRVHSFMRELDMLFDFMSFGSGEIPSEISALVEEREAARKSGDFAKSDELRAMIRKKGFSVDDTKDGPRVRKV